MITPEVNGKWHSDSHPNVFVIDLTFLPTRLSTIKEIDTLMKKSSQFYLTGMLEFMDEKIVSFDLIHSKISSIYDSITTTWNNFKGEKNRFKIIAYYDKGWGNSHRVVDLLRYMMPRKFRHL